MTEVNVRWMKQELFDLVAMCGKGKAGLHQGPESWWSSLQFLSRSVEAAANATNSPSIYAFWASIAGGKETTLKFLRSSRSTADAAD
jgi:hypothetical protein